MSIKPDLLTFQVQFSSRIESYYTETVNRFRQTATTLVNRMVVELESGGNVRFEEGTPSDMW